MYSVPSLAALFVITFFLARGTWRVVNKEWESSERSSALAEKAAILVLREQTLKENISRLQTEKGIKDEIKLRFNVIEEGEHVAVIVDKRRGSSTTENSTLSWYKRFWVAIMGRK